VALIIVIIINVMVLGVYVCIFNGMSFIEKNGTVAVLSLLYSALLVHYAVKSIS
jgi:hypothetical protein